MSLNQVHLGLIGLMALLALAVVIGGNMPEDNPAVAEQVRD